MLWVEKCYRNSKLFIISGLSPEWGYLGCPGITSGKGSCVDGIPCGNIDHFNVTPGMILLFCLNKENCVIDLWSYHLSPNAVSIKCSIPGQANQCMQSLHVSPALASQISPLCPLSTTLKLSDCSLALAVFLIVVFTFIVLRAFK